MTKLGKNIKQARFKSAEQLLFLNYLQQILDSGYSLNEGLSILQTFWPSKKEVLHDFALKLESGQSFGDLLVQYGFNQTIAAQLDLAMQEGNISACLNQLSQLLKVKEKQLKRLKSELAYPALLVMMLLSLLIFMQTFLKEFSSTMGIGNLILIGLSILFLLFLGGLFWLLVLLKRQDYISLKKLAYFPVIKTPIRLYVHYLVIYDLSFLLKNGFSLRQICQLNEEQPKGSLQAVLANKVRLKLEQGKTLQEIIDHELFLPNALNWLLNTGTSPEALGDKLLLFGHTLFFELVISLKKVVLNVQPICLLMIGAAVIGIYLTLLLPMYGMMQHL